VHVKFFIPLNVANPLPPSPDRQWPAPFQACIDTVYGPYRDNVQVMEAVKKLKEDGKNVDNFLLIDGCIISVSPSDNPR
jgi:hypothetical protein